MPDSSKRQAGRVVVILCAIVASIALVVLVGGWLLDIPRLRAPLLRWSPMAPLTAVLLLLSSGGSSQLFPRPRLGKALLVTTMLLAGLILLEYFTGAPRALETLSHSFQRGAGTPIPELPAPDTAAAFILVAAALLCMCARSAFLHDFADVVAAVITMICLQVLIAYVYNIAHSTALTGYRQIAPHTTVSMMMLAFTVVAQRPTAGIFWSMRGRADSAMLLRRLLPVTVLSCLLVGFLEVEAMQARVGGNIPEIVAWSITGAVLVLALLLFVASAGMRKTEAMVRRREQDLVDAMKVAEAASNTKSRFMAVMGHELRTPLTAMLGYADLLDAGVAGPLSADARKFVERIRTSGWHLVGLIDAVLLYASGMRTGEQPRNQRVDLSALIREIIVGFEDLAARKGIALHALLPDSIIIASDHAKLREILINLMSNAVKFTDEGGVTITADTRGEDVVIEIRDTGIGIDAQHLEHIWEPFEQADEPHTRAHGGMGLGMALTRMLSDQIGGRLALSSAVGKGTSITLRLPAALEAARGSDGLKDKHILVVDDDVAVLRIMSRALARHGARITEATNGEEAIEHLRRHDSVDVIVTDISMPRMSGIELVRTLNQRGNVPPVVFVTGADLSAEDRTEVHVLGGRLLTKPFDMSELAHIVVATSNGGRSA